MVGRRFEVEVGPPAHGGHCVARVADEGNRVVFVRHAIPGERVVVELTEGTEGDRFWRGDAVELLGASPDRVAAPCPYAGPGLCGGCDFQHVELGRQRALKAEVVREQLSRLARLDVDVTVEPVAGDREGLEWRTRQRYVQLPGGRIGMRKHRSHDVVPIDRCLIEGPRVDEAELHTVRGQRFRVASGSDAFWQVHPGAPEVLVGAVLDALSPAAGESALDLYAGVGLFSRFLLGAVGPGGRVVAVEGDPAASRLSLSNCPGVEAAAGDVATVLATAYPEAFDIVVLDPPRAGAREQVLQLAAAGTARIVYISCNPSSWARDARVLADAGYRLAELRPVGQFRWSTHVELASLFVR